MGKLMSLYLPKRSIKKGERLLIVDDVIRSGETQRALLRLAKKMNAQIAGLFAVVAVGDKGIRALENEMPPDNIEALVKL
jgi:adenine/guanine phosphoribosyltransferase-like PRPP-binding protein